MTELGITENYDKFNKHKGQINYVNGHQVTWHDTEVKKLSQEEREERIERLKEILTRQPNNEMVQRLIVALGKLGKLGKS